MKRTLTVLCLFVQTVCAGEFQELYNSLATEGELSSDSKKEFFNRLTKDLPYETELDLDGAKFRAWWEANNSYSLSSLKNEGKYIAFQLEDKYLIGNIFHADVPFTFDDLNHYLTHVIGYRHLKYQSIKSEGLERSRDVAYVDYESLVYGMRMNRESLSSEYKQYLDTQLEISDDASNQFEMLVIRYREKTKVSSR
ncbi:hypothetical protein [Pelagicoccus mobilis]|uniref:Uncharacterized protein n=1 Tax=Pelagicoccus mobilis TaxID=415221 RepID=A0A934VPG9_9BACT|nr:hypothetical protein [Pelagicoccus mobilis]MBK1875810.1 hypothetical protein [Pelagicoccus mobilis]